MIDEIFSDLEIKSEPLPMDERFLHKYSDKIFLRKSRGSCMIIGTDGNPLNLHHMLQSNSSAIAAVTQTFHQQNSKVIHINPSSMPSGIDRAAFDAWKTRYWIDRAANYKP